MIDYTLTRERDLKREAVAMQKFVAKVLEFIDRNIDKAMFKILDLPTDIDIHNGVKLEEGFDFNKCKNEKLDKIIRKMRRGRR